MFKWMFLPLKRYAQFSGRSCRKEYWLWTLFNVFAPSLFTVPLIVAFVAYSSQLAALDDAGFDPESLSEIFPAALIVFLLGIAVLILLFGLAMFIPNLALSYRRFHDCNIPNGWFWGLFVASIVPVFGGLPGLAIFIIVGFVPGTKGPNRFGPDPRTGPGQPPLEPFASAGAAGAAAAPALASPSAEDVARAWPKN